MVFVIHFHLSDSSYGYKASICISPILASKIKDDQQALSHRMPDRVRNGLYMALGEETLWRQLTFQPTSDFKSYPPVVFYTTSDAFIFGGLKLRRTPQTEKIVLQICEEINVYASHIELDFDYTEYIEKLHGITLRFALPKSDRPRLTREMWDKFWGLQIRRIIGFELVVENIVTDEKTIQFFCYIYDTKTMYPKIFSYPLPSVN